MDNQIFFGVSELLAMSCCVLLLDSSRSSLSIQQAQIWTSCIALSHFGLAVLDQWRGGYFMIASTSHQRLRDLFLLVPELVSICSLFWFLSKKKNLVGCVCFVFSKETLEANFEICSYFNYWRPRVVCSIADKIHLDASFIKNSYLLFFFFFYTSFLKRRRMLCTKTLKLLSWFKLASNWS